MRIEIGTRRFPSRRKRIFMKPQRPTIGSYDGRRVKLSIAPPLYRGNLPIRNSPKAKCHLWFLKKGTSQDPKPPSPS